MKWFLISLSLIAGCSAACCCGGDYTVTRSATVESQRPIWLLVLETGMGVLNGRHERPRGEWLEDVGNLCTRLSLDGHHAPGIGGMAQAVWRLGGFILWGADGSVERETDLRFRGRAVRILDGASNGRVWVRVTVGPPLGDPRVKYAVLTLEAYDHERLDEILGRTRGGYSPGASVLLTCSAVIDLPCDARRERVHARRQRRGCDRQTLSERIAGDEAGPELSSRVNDLIRAGAGYTYAGRERLIEAFLRDTCR